MNIENVTREVDSEVVLHEELRRRRRKLDTVILFLSNFCLELGG